MHIQQESGHSLSILPFDYAIWIKLPIVQTLQACIDCKQIQGNRINKDFIFLVSMFNPSGDKKKCT